MIVLLSESGLRLAHLDSMVPPGIMSLITSLKVCEAQLVSMFSILYKEPWLKQVGPGIIYTTFIPTAIELSWRTTLFINTHTDPHTHSHTHYLITLNCLLISFKFSSYKMTPNFPSQSQFTPLYMFCGPTNRATYCSLHKPCTLLSPCVCPYCFLRQTCLPPANILPISICQNPAHCSRPFSDATLTIKLLLIPRTKQEPLLLPHVTTIPAATFFLYLSQGTSISNNNS